MIENIWYSSVIICCILALSNWRLGIYLGILLDCLRDPLRKLTIDQSVLITLTGMLVWGFVIVGAIQQNQTELRQIFQRYRSIRSMLGALTLALVPAAAISIFLYQNGWKVAVVGAISYLAPLVGIAVGYLIPRSESDVERLFKFYVGVNSLMLVGVPLEYLDYNIPALGGIDANWIRYRTGYIVDLMCGFYRSPDIMGLHAAHVIMFSLILALREKATSRPFWMSLALWATFCILLSGRRKMIGIPMIFVVAFLCFSTVRKAKGASRLATITAVAACTFATLGSLFWSPDASKEYHDFASSLFTEGVSRSNEVIVASSIETLRQAGILGSGLGMATQGRYYVKSKGDAGGRNWQEDGVSRLILEFGVPGCLLLGVAGYQLLVSLKKAFQMVPRGSPEQEVQIACASVVCGDAASFAISHQQFSGDPVNGLFVLLMLGMVLGIPRVYFRRQSRLRYLAPAVRVINRPRLQAASSGS